MSRNSEYEPASWAIPRARRAFQPTPSAPATADRPVFLTPEELAELLKLPSVETVYQWRRKHTGPPGFRAGRHVRYNLAAVLAWAEQETGKAA
ncbi:helix-turn-helix domain-containing protein [Actinoplanes sp. NPDC026623]|uniref:helix-turn-helix domain-containing protein n=1 Tax=Actinoplanes sp. NPDC026623 TaxID=3155610 RepID=UPI0033D387BD